jgi:hypothetical protein
MRRGREVHPLDLGYTESSLALERPARTGGLLAGDRAADAPVLGAAGQPSRLFTRFAGPHWTLLGRDVADEVPARPGLHIHDIGARGDLVDWDGHVERAYALAPGGQVLIRPDGYVGAIVGAGEGATLEEYLALVGLGLEHER